VHPQWSLYNPGATVECGKATWSYIVDRQFKVRGGQTTMAEVYSHV